MLSPEEEQKIRQFFKVTLPDILNKLDAIELKVEEVFWKKSLSEPKESVGD